MMGTIKRACTLILVNEGHNEALFRDPLNTTKDLNLPSSLPRLYIRFTNNVSYISTSVPSPAIELWLSSHHSSHLRTNSVSQHSCWKLSSNKDSVMIQVFLKPMVKNTHYFPQHEVRSVKKSFFIIRSSETILFSSLILVIFVHRPQYQECLSSLYVQGSLQSMHCTSEGRTSWSLKNRIAAFSSRKNCLINCQ